MLHWFMPVHDIKLFFSVGVWVRTSGKSVASARIRSWCTNKKTSGNPSSCSQSTSFSYDILKKKKKDLRNYSDNTLYYLRVLLLLIDDYVIEKFLTLWKILSINVLVLLSVFKLFSANESSIKFAISMTTQIRHLQKRGGKFEMESTKIDEKISNKNH